MAGVEYGKVKNLCIIGINKPTGVMPVFCLFVCLFVFWRFLFVLFLPSVSFGTPSYSSVLKTCTSNMTGSPTNSNSSVPASVRFFACKQHSSLSSLKVKMCTVKFLCPQRGREGRGGDVCTQATSKQPASLLMLKFLLSIAL